MPLFVKDKPRIWPAGTIKYLVKPNTPNAQAAVEEINEEIGYTLFEKITEALGPDQSFIEIGKGGGNANTIGFKGNKKYPMTGEKHATFQHEIMHVIGFFHEQYHNQFPWISADPGLPDPSKFKDNNMFSFTVLVTDKVTKQKSKQLLLKSDWNMALYKSLVTNFGTEMGADEDRKFYYRYTTDKTVEHMQPCDFASVMMYPHACKAALAVREASLELWPRGLKFVQGKKVGKGKSLSEYDVKAIQHLYPKPR